jgi:putative transposase
VTVTGKLEATMPRRARLNIPGIPWHIIQRGNNRSRCFHAVDDYRRYLDALGEQATKYDCVVHAYVLMTNHVHLLLTPHQPDSAPLLMKHLGQRYVQKFNRRYGRTGTLWEGRYRSCLTDSAAYVLACYRYIERNPVRAGMVDRPEDYPWSSYRANGLGRADPLVTAHDEYRRLGPNDEERRFHYRALFQSRVDSGFMAEIRYATNGNYALGSSLFRAKVERMLKRRATPGKNGRPRK